MIKQIEIENYQSHRKTVIKPHKRITAITGPSHIGKSSVMRANQSIILNNFITPNFKNWNAGKKENIVNSLIFDDDTFVIRERGTDLNAYITNEDTYEAMRGEVPDEVLAILQMDKLNIQTQHEEYFFLQATPGERAKQLNSIVGLDVINEVLSGANKLISKVDGKLKTTESELANVEERLVEFKELDYLISVLSELEMLHQSEQELIIKYDKVKELSDQIQFTLQLKEKVNKILQYKYQIEDIDYLLFGHEEYIIKIDRLCDIVNKITDNENELDKHQVLIKQTDVINEASLLIDEYKKKAHELKSIKNLTRSIHDTEIARQNAGDSLIEASDKLSKYNLCPTCGQELKDGHTLFD